MSYIDNPYYYDILEVGKHASQEEIKASFRRLAKEYHPDSGHFRSPSQKREAQEIFKLTNAAYHILKDPIKRTEYDTFFNYIIWDQVVDADTEEKRYGQSSYSCGWTSLNCFGEANIEYGGKFYCFEHYALVKKSEPVLVMIRNACLAGMIFGFLGLIFGRIDLAKCSGIYMIVLSYGVYMRSRTYASTLFIMMLMMFASMVALLVFSEEWGAWMIILIPLVLLYFSFKGMRGTFTYHKLCYEEDSNSIPASKKFYFVRLPLLIIPIVLYCSLILVQSGVLKSKVSNSAKRIPIVTDNINKDINGENTKSKPIKLGREYQLDSDGAPIAKIYHSEGKEIYKEIYDNEFSVIKRIGKIPYEIAFGEVGE